MAIQPYLFFDGRCEEAIEFYKKSVGAEVGMMMRFKDAPPGHGPAMAPGTGDKIMHANVTLGGSSVLMSDGRCEGKAAFEGFALSLTTGDVGKAQKTFEALAEGGQVTMPMEKTFFSPKFGMLKDRFGVHWMVYVQGTPARGG